MKRIATANRAIDLFGAGKDGFKPAVAGVSDATYLSSLWANHVQEGLARIREAAGIAVPADDDFDWMVTSIKALIDEQSGNYALDTGVANAYVVALDPPITAYTNGMTVRFRAVNANTGAATLNAGGGVVSLKNDIGGALVSGDLPAGFVVSATYDSAAAAWLINSLVPSQALTQAAADVRYAALAGLASQVFSVATATAAAHATPLGEFVGVNSSTGYIKFPTIVAGVKRTLIFQWGGGGTTNATDSEQVINFPIVFPNACLRVLPTQTLDSGGGVMSYGVIGTPTTTSWRAYSMMSIAGGSPHHSPLYLAVGY